MLTILHRGLETTVEAIDPHVSHFFQPSHSFRRHFLRVNFLKQYQMQQAHQEPVKPNSEQHHHHQSQNKDDNCKHRHYPEEYQAHV